jgi:predicted ATPase
VTQLALPPLRAEESQAIVATVPDTAQLSVAQCQQIIAHGMGNPFFVEELAWHAVEHGLAATPVPETVHAVLAARLDRLPAAAKALLQTAAVIDLEVPGPLVQAMAELPEAALHRGLAHVQAAEFLSETRLFPEQVYTFKHALTHEVTYSSLLQARRCALHARLVEVLEVLSSERLAKEVDRLAHHAMRGEVWDTAVTYCRQVGEKALARSATARPWTTSSRRLLLSRICLRRVPGTSRRSISSSLCARRSGRRATGAYAGVSTRGRGPRGGPRCPASARIGRELSGPPFLQAGRV